ncbi:MAG: sulfatase, partial [Verrucomicrobiales bacterium]|nr:sulfatase [Verrucomicrobiales bacterium]
PNILIIVADQWRAQAFGHAGDPNVHTPNLDKLARASVNVTNAISGCPVCSPFRASLMTGQRPLTHGVFVNDVPLNTNAITIAKVLKNAGYDTGCIGKWHIDGHGRDTFIPRERRQGFDYWKVRECSHDYNDSTYYSDAPTKLKWNGYDAFAQTDDAKTYIAQHATNAKPFFLLLAWGPPHNPYDTAPEQYKQMYRAEDLKLRPNVPASVAEKTRKDLAGYYAHCTALDRCIGDLWQTLKDAGIDKDTIVIFTSDHGDMQGSQGNIRKQRPWDESIRIPLLIHYPAAFGDAGKQSGALINAQDLMPTILGLGKVRIPGTVEGFDYSNFLLRSRGKVPDCALLTCVVPFGEYTRKIGGREYRGIRTERYTYVRDLNGPWLLFDNQADPYQMTNLCSRAGAKSIQVKLDEKLQKQLRETDDKFLPAQSYLDKWNYVMLPKGSTRARDQ